LIQSKHKCPQGHLCFLRELTREEVESIRDSATAIELSSDIAEDMVNYPGIDPEKVWSEWLAYKARRST